MDKFYYTFETADPRAKEAVPAAAADSKTAYLTFDDGPSGFTPQLLKILKENAVKATFFVSFQGEDTPEKRSILKQEANEGHTVGVHTWSHDFFSIYANEESFLYDFKKMRDVIRAETGTDPKVSRFPGGIGNTVSMIAACGHVIMPSLVRHVEAMGIKPFDWNAGGQDAECPFPPSRQLVRDILTEADGKNNLVVLMHDTHQFTIDAAPDLIRSLKARGYVFRVLNPESPPVRQAFARKDEVVLHLKKSLRLMGDLVELLERH